MTVRNLQIKDKKNSDMASRISTLEKEVLALKRYFKFIKGESDEEIWERIKPLYEKVQKRIFKEKYPALYEKAKKEK